MLNRLTDSLDFQGQALQLRSERQRLIASNLANADTPGYVARDMYFAATLRAETGTPPRPPPTPGNTAHADAPGYVARDMDFAKTLRAATGTLPASAALAATRPG